jgi:hypothetical protein
VARAFRSIVQGFATGHANLGRRFVVSLAAIVERLDQGE